MWARVIEVMLGCWLAMSPFVFRHPAQNRAWWINDFACAGGIVTLALVSYWRPLRHAHLAIVVVAFWLIGFGYFSAHHPLPPALQNDLLLGLLLAMVAIVPNNAAHPPDAWHDINQP